MCCWGWDSGSVRTSILPSKPHPHPHVRIFLMSAPQFTLVFNLKLILRAACHLPVSANSQLWIMLPCRSCCLAASLGVCQPFFRPFLPWPLSASSVQTMGSSFFFVVVVACVCVPVLLPPKIFQNMMFWLECTSLVEGFPSMCEALASLAGLRTNSACHFIEKCSQRACIGM